jgi:hypothetical protein
MRGKRGRKQGLNSNSARLASVRRRGPREADVIDTDVQGSRLIQESRTRAERREMRGGWQREGERGVDWFPFVRGPERECRLIEVE